MLTARFPFSFFPVFLSSFYFIFTSFAVFEVFNEHLRRSSPFELLRSFPFLSAHFVRSSFTSVNTFDGLLRRTSTLSDPRLGIQEPSPRIPVFIRLFLTIFLVYSSTP